MFWTRKTLSPMWRCVHQGWGCFKRHNILTSLEEQRQFAPHITPALQGIHPQMMHLRQVSSQSTEVSLFILPFVSCFRLWLIFSEEQPVPQELEAIPVLAYRNSKFWSNESLLLMRKSVTEIFHVHPTRAGLVSTNRGTSSSSHVLYCYFNVDPFISTTLFLPPPKYLRVQRGLRSPSRQARWSRIQAIAFHA